ncbi:MAG: S1C family serine protease [Patescibacteria group bacterium]
MEKVSKKISIADDLNNGDNLEINKIGRPDTGLKERLKIDKEVKDFYQETIVSPLTSPRKSRSFGFGRFILRVLLSLIFGALGAIFILTRQSVYLPLVGEINLQKYFPAREVNLTTEKKVTVTQDVRMDELIKTIKPQFVRLFESKESANSKNLTFLDQIYTPNQTKGSAVILTNNGWLLTSNSLDPKNKYAAVNNENKIFPIEKIVQDGSTNLTFLKATADNLSAAKLASRDDLAVGQQILIFDQQNNVYLSEVRQINFRPIKKNDDLIRSTDYFSDFLLASRDLNSDNFEGAVVFGLDGSLVGLVFQNKIIPVWRFQDILPQVLKGEKISRNYLGIDYLRIEEAPGLISERFRGLENGAIVYGDPFKNSPADLAGIKNGDVIIKADGLPLTYNQDLTYLVQNKKFSDPFEVVILRDGKEQSITVNLVQK